MAVWRKSFSVPLMCFWQIERLFLCRTEFLLTDRNRTDLRICHLHSTDTSKALQFYRAPLLMFAYSIGEHQQGSAISDLDESRHAARQPDWSNCTNCIWLQFAQRVEATKLWTWAFFRLYGFLVSYLIVFSLFVCKINSFGQNSKTALCV